MPGKRMSKIQFVTALAEKSGLTKKQAMAAFDTMSAMVVQELGKQGPGEVLIPGMLLLDVVDRPATPEHDGINPFTREVMTFKAKVARKVVRVRSLKSLRDPV